MIRKVFGLHACAVDGCRTDTLEKDIAQFQPRADVSYVY